MIALWLFPAVLSLLVLGAHFLRSGHTVVVASLLMLVVVLLFVRRWWAARLTQATLVAGAGEWVRTLVELVRERAGAGQPMTRMAIILGSVAAATALSAFVFRSQRIRNRYGLGDAASR